jgi:uncharacterized protein (DUF1501 family)
VMANGSGGTDHGTGGVAFLVGGSVKGGRVIGRWPGLAQNQLFEGRDLFPSNDIRSLLAGVLSTHFELPDDALRGQVFPGLDDVAIWKGLV